METININLPKGYKDYKIMTDFDYLKIRELTRTGLSIVSTKMDDDDETAGLLWPIFQCASDIFDKHYNTPDALFRLEEELKDKPDEEIANAGTEEELKRTTSKEMMGVELSDDTKKFLVAHRMMQEVYDLVLEHMIEVWGGSTDYVHKRTQALSDLTGKVQAEILKLMTEHINEMMGSRSVSEI